MDCRIKSGNDRRKKTEHDSNSKHQHQKRRCKNKGMAQYFKSKEPRRQLLAAEFRVVVVVVVVVVAILEGRG